VKSVPVTIKRESQSHPAVCDLLSKRFEYGGRHEVPQFWPLAETEELRAHKAKLTKSSSKEIKRGTADVGNSSSVLISVRP
jgi:hypothetical protein